MNQALQDLGDRIASARAGEVERVVLSHGELTLWTRPDALLRLMQHLRDDPDCLFKMLVDICGVDYLDRAERFEVVYHLLSLKHNLRVRVKVAATEEQPVPSVTGLFKTAGWFEREAWDLYGIFFSDHPDLRRLLTDYGFEGHPLRKDFPLTGYVEMRYDDEQKRVIYEPVRLAQEFRSFDFLSPWEGMTLPGDEKAEKSS
ncbi:MAG: NADH-quinone oxidoreductase subunit C [Dongiaceae bacterium]